MTKNTISLFTTQIKRNKLSLAMGHDVTLEQAKLITDCEIHLISTVAKLINPNFNSYQFQKDCGQDIF